MLVLGRKVNQAIVIGEGIRVVLCESQDGKARIGIEADRSVPVWREELLTRAATPDPEGDGNGSSNQNL